MIWRIFSMKMRHQQQASFFISAAFSENGFLVLSFFVRK